LNAWSKLLVLMILLAVGYVAYRASAGDWKGWVDQPSVFPDSIDANLFGTSLVQADSVSRVDGDPAVDAALARGAGAGQSTLPALGQLRNECKAWLRRLGYDDSAERVSKE
jgi:hypothetical protein